MEPTDSTIVSEIAGYIRKSLLQSHNYFAAIAIVYSQLGASEPVQQVWHLLDQYFREPHMPSLLSRSLQWDSVLDKNLNHKKSLMFKYGRMKKEISFRLVCGTHGACLDCLLPGVEVTTGLGFFLCSSYLCDSEDCDSLL